MLTLSKNEDGDFFVVLDGDTTAESEEEECLTVTFVSPENDKEDLDEEGMGHYLFTLDGKELRVNVLDMFEFIQKVGFLHEVGHGIRGGALLESAVIAENDRLREHIRLLEGTNNFKAGYISGLEKKLKSGGGEAGVSKS